ncbi:MAG: metallophosphoesterase [Rhodospirillaceae bacterium]
MSQLKYCLLGDPHLGRSTRAGTPLHRLGDREKMVWEDFETSFRGDFDVHVCMGDLFDRPNMPLKLILDVYKVYVEADPSKKLILLAGNHDLTKSSDGVSAFDILEEMLSKERGVIVVKGAPDIYDNRLFVPYHPTKTAQELVAPFADQRFTAVYGHWDLDWVGPNQIPIEQLKGMTNTVYTGHIHKPETRTYGNLTVNVVGSMQPYAFGESSEQEEVRRPRYVTCYLAELDKLHRDTVVRLVLDEGESAPDELDFLQITTRRLQDLDEEIVEVKFDDFDLDALFRQALLEAGVSQKTMRELNELRQDAME